MTRIKPKRNRWATWFLAAVAAIGITAIVVHHLRPKSITSDDISIIGTALTLAATGLAFRAAQESRDAADESRRALTLHFRPGSVRIEFRVRDPRDPETQMGWTPVPSPAPLFAVILFRDEIQDEYTLEWVDGYGATRSITVIPTPGVEQVYKIDGVDAEEDRTGPFAQVVAAVPRLSLACRDLHVGAQWKATRSWPVRQALGSYGFTFEPAD